MARETVGIVKTFRFRSWWTCYNIVVINSRLKWIYSNILIIWLSSSRFTTIDHKHAHDFAVTATIRLSVCVYNMQMNAKRSRITIYRLCLSSVSLLRSKCSSFSFCSRRMSITFVQIIYYCDFVIYHAYNGGG